MLVIKNISSYVGRHYSGIIGGEEYDWSVCGGRTELSRCDPKGEVYEIAFYNYDSQSTEIATLNIHRKVEECGGYRCQIYYTDYKTLLWEDTLSLRYIADANSLLAWVVKHIVSESIRRKGSV